MGLCTAQGKVLMLCVKLLRESLNLELAHLKKKKKERFGQLVTFWL